MTQTLYYAFIDGVQKGPFTIEQLLNSEIRPSTYVWCKEMDDWQRADSVPEIRNFFKHHLETKAERNREPVAHEDNYPSQAIPVSEEKAVAEEKPRRVGFPLPENTVEEDFNRPPQVSMTLAILSLLFCFFPTGIISVVFTYKAQKSWENSNFMGESTEKEDLRRKAHEYERLAKMWLGLTVAFGIIFWTLIFSVRK